MRLVIIFLFLVIPIPSFGNDKVDSKLGWGLLDECSFDARSEEIIQEAMSTNQGIASDSIGSDRGLRIAKQLESLGEVTQFNFYTCMSYFRGAAEILNLWRFAETPATICKGSLNDMRLASIKYLRENPEFLNAPRGFAVMTGFLKAYKCENENNEGKAVEGIDKLDNQQDLVPKREPANDFDEEILKGGDLLKKLEDMR